MADKTVVNYVDKKKLYDVLCEWHAKKIEAEAAGKPAPKLPEYVGECILKIADGLALRWNFRQYTWIEEMKGEGVIAAVKAMNKFDPTRKGKSGEVNPFGFINFVLWRTFGNVITDEKRHLALKMSIMTDPEFESYENDEFSDFDIDNSGLNEFFHRGQ